MAGKLTLTSLFGRKSWKSAKGDAGVVQKQITEVSLASTEADMFGMSVSEQNLDRQPSSVFFIAVSDDALATSAVGMHPTSPGHGERLDDSNGSSGYTTDPGVRGVEWEERSSQDTGDAGLAGGGHHDHVLDIIESDDDYEDDEDGRRCTLMQNDYSETPKEILAHGQETVHQQDVNGFGEKTGIYSPEGFHHMADSSSDVGSSGRGALSDVGCEHKEAGLEWDNSQSAQSEPMQGQRHWESTLSEDGKQVDFTHSEGSDHDDVGQMLSKAMVVAADMTPCTLPGPARLRWMKEVHVQMPLQMHVGEDWQQKFREASTGVCKEVAREKGGVDCSLGIAASAVVDDKGGDVDGVVKVTIAVETPSNAAMARVQEWVTSLCGDGKYLVDHAAGPQLVLGGPEQMPEEVTADWSDEEYPGVVNRPLTGVDVNAKYAQGKGKVGVEVHDVDAAEELAAKCVGVLERGAVIAAFPSCGLRVIPALAGFHHLKKLNLSQNFIARITPGALPPTLHVLDLSHNNITAIEGLKDLSRLRVLNLSHNKLSRIGHGLAGCVKLREVYLSDNKISEAEGLHRLLKLALLDLAHNKLTSTKSLGQLAANYGTLQALNLAGNPVHVNLSEDAFRKFILGLLPRLCFLNQTPLKSGGVSRDMSADNLARAALASGGHHSTLRSGGVKGRSSGGTSRNRTGDSSAALQLGGRRSGHGSGRGGGGGGGGQSGWQG